MRKKKTFNAVRDGAFPSPSTSRESSQSSSKSKGGLYPPMLGQATINKILATGSPTREAKSAVDSSVQNQKHRAYKPLSYDISPMNSMDTHPRSNFRKMKDARAKTSLSLVTEASVEDTNAHSTQEDSSCSMSSISLNTAKRSNGRKLSSPRGRFRRHKSKEMSSNYDSDSLINNETIRPMQDIIMQQHEFIRRLGLENKQCRESMVLFQEQVTSLEKEQADQKNELQKLRLQKHSLEAEAASLREEIETMRLQLLVQKFSERGPLSAKETSTSRNQETKRQSLRPPSSVRVDFPLPPEQEPVASCTDLQDLQAGGVEFYEFVSKFKLEEPMNSKDYYSSKKLATKRSGKDEEEEHSSNSATRNRQQKGDSGLRFSRGKSG